MIYLVTNQNQLFDNDLYKIISTEKSLELLSTLSVVGLDTETTGLDCYTDKLLSLQLGNRNFQVVIDCSTIDISLYKDFIESDRTFCGWNLKFDLKFLFRNNIYPKKVYDGFLAEKLLWLGYPAGMHSLSLKSAGENYLGVELDKSVRGKIIYQGLNYDTIVYAARDVEFLEDIILKQWKELRKKELHNAIKVENQFVIPLAYMEYCGIKLDIDRWKNKMAKDRASLEEEENALNKWVCENLSDDRRFTKVDLQGDLFNGFNTEPQCIINWSSPMQVIPLFKALGFNLQAKDKTTGNFKDSIEAKVIKPQQNLSTIAPIYLRYKAAAKVVGTYGQNFLDQVNPVSGRIHTNYSQLGADTTRLTSGGKDKSSKTEYVNLLNIPSDGETRACFIAENGNKWISIDYSGQESFIMGDMANDKAILHELNYGDKDLHTLTAKIVFDYIPKDMSAKEVKQKFHKERQLSKGYEFAFNYAGNANTIKANFGLTDEEADRIYNAYMSGFDGLKRYQDFRRKDWWNKGYILLNPITGHKAFIYDHNNLKEIQESFKEDGFWDHYREMKTKDPNSYTVQKVKKLFKRKADSDRQSVNYPIQATGSQCLRFSMIYFWDYLRDNSLIDKVKICVAPYDEINCEAPEEIAEEVAKTLYNCMVKAGALFCTRCKLDAEISRQEDGSLPNFWIH